MGREGRDSPGDRRGYNAGGSGVMSKHLAVDPLVLAQFCRRDGIARLSLFGSVLHGQDRADSDLDLLVEFLPDTRIGLIGLAALERELSDLLGRKVDLRTPQDLSPRFRDEVLRTAMTQYAA
jgi:predicted nucleotidyltransferase